jgi:hypothetical protein
MPEQTTTLPCGCKYQDKGFMIVRVVECDYHRQRRTRKRPYRPKAECVRP